MAITTDEIAFEYEVCTELIFVSRVVIQTSLGAGTMLPKWWSVVNAGHDVKHAQLLDSLSVGATMNANAAAIDAVFIGKQQEALLKLRAALLHAAQADEDDEGDIRGESRGSPREYEDDAQKLALLEVDGNRVVRSLNRLNLVIRALQKIAEGTYGLSDLSGKPIPRQRLEAVPEAICTLDEEQRFELRADHGPVAKL
jgi:DnaK suppressor protein